MRSRPLLALWASFLLAGCGKSPEPPAPPPPPPPAPAAKKEAPPAEETGTKKEGPAAPASVPSVDAPKESLPAIAGRVKFKGKIPARAPVAAAGNADCQAVHKKTPILEEGIIVNDDKETLRNVFLWVEGDFASPFPVPTGPVVLDQKACAFVPHVVGARAGQTLRMKNSDSFSHNVNCSPGVNKGFNQGIVAGETLDKIFAKPGEQILVACNVHAWMNAWVCVVDNPFYAVTDEKGAFLIPKLPPGTYTLNAWHESPALGKQSQQVKVEEGKAASVEFTFEKKEDEGEANP